MAAVHIITIPCEPNTAHKVQEKPYFCNICPCTMNITCVGFEVVRTVLYVFMTADRLAQLIEHRTAAREVAGSNLDRTNTQGL